MPAIIAVLLQGLLFLTKSFVGRVLVALGMATVSYTGMSATLSWLKAGAISALQGMGGEYVALLSYMKVGTSISIISSALVARMLVNGLQSDTVKRLVIK